MRVVGLIPARAGSKGVPGKNRRRYRGHPLWQVALGIGLRTCDRAYVSTDDPLIINTIAPADQIVVRPAKLAQDDTPMLDVLKHFVTVVDCDLVVLLQPTQPLRKIEHVRAALDLMERTGADSVVSVCEIPAHMSPDWAYVIGDGKVAPWSKSGAGWWALDDVEGCRQDLEPAYYRDGTVYVLKPEIIKSDRMYGDHCVPLIIPRSESCSIDTEEDWKLAEVMAADAEADPEQRADPVERS